MIVNRTRIPSAPLVALIKWVQAHMSVEASQANILIMYKKRNTRISGHAAKFGFVHGRKARGTPPNEPLVSIEVGTTWEQRGYPIEETYKKRAGSMRYDNWQEHFVALIAHELRHIEQYHLSYEERSKLGSREVDAERHAMRVLAQYKRSPLDQMSNAAKKETKECPRCHRAGEIASMFGYRTIKGKNVIPQSYCHDCRRAHARERRGL